MSDRDDDLRELRDALEARGPELVDYLLGFARNRSMSNRRVARWGRKGSFVLNIAGPHRGRWVDWEAGDKGDLFALIMRHEVGDFASAVRWARDWMGWGDGPAPAPRRSDALRREREAKAAQLVIEAARENKARIEAARRIWNEAGPIEGTLGERYLVETRAIAAARWPSCIRWHERRRAVVVAVTDEAGEVVAVQMIRVAKDATKDTTRGPAKLSRGPVSLGYVLLPGRADGPVCLCEGPETGLSVWAATGYETRVYLGSVTGATPPKGRRVVVCCDDDPRMSSSAKKRRDAVKAWRAAGHDVVEAHPYETRRQDKSDFNKLAQEQGLDAVRRRVGLVAVDAPTIAQRLVPVVEGRERINARVGEFFAAAAQFKEGDEPIAHALGLTVGTGKTEAALNHILHTVCGLRAKGDKRAVVIAVPEHRLSGELVERFNAMASKEGLNLRADCWRGREALRPDAVDDADKMCRDVETVREAQRLSVDVDAEVCQVCPHNNGCAYLAQRGRDADLWVVAHPIIFHRLPSPVKRAGLAALVVDESPWQAGLFGIEGQGVEVALDALGVMPAPPGLDGEHLIDIRTRLAMAMAGEPDGPVRRAALDAVGFDAETGLVAGKLEWRRKVEDGPWRERDDNRTLGAMAAMWRAVAALMAYRGPERSGWLELTRNRDGARVLRVTGRAEVGEGWRVPTLLVDAVLDVDLVRPFWPAVEKRAHLAVDAPHQVIRQASGKSYAKSYLAPPKSEDADDAPRARARRNARAVILRRARELGGKVLVVGNKGVVEAMGFPADVEVAWFNAVAGRDQWKDARLVVILGRPMPSPGAVERMAAALTGKAVDRLPGWYERGDGFRTVRDGDGLRRVPCEVDRHPDRVAEAVRERICAGELVQAIGRGRGVNRGPDDPVEVLVLGDAVLPMPVDELLGDEAVKPSPVDLMLAEGGGIAFEDAAAAFKAYPQLWPSHAAAKKALQREHKGTIPYKEYLIGKCPLLVFQREGERRRPEQAFYDPRRVPDPHAAVEAMLGPLAKFEIAEPVEPMPSTPSFEAVGNLALALPESAVVVAAPEPEAAIDPEPEPPPAPVPKVFIDWPLVRQKAADAGLKLGDVARSAGISPGQFRNIQTGHRTATPEVAAAIEAVIRKAQPVQGRLL